MWIDVLTRLKFHLWRQDVDHPNWSRKTKLKEWTKDRPSPEAKISRKGTSTPFIWTKTFIYLGWTKISCNSVKQNFQSIRLNKTSWQNSCINLNFEIIESVNIQRPHFDLSVLDWNRQFFKQLLFFLHFCCSIDSPLISLFQVYLTC